mmetsp:Transcript_31/g.83  ORF Transcript_31/g.83 Transcript_31/m.83 type:complete len:356 (-) Transcript_31:309-1376(-)
MRSSWTCNNSSVISFAFNSLSRKAFSNACCRCPCSSSKAARHSANSLCSSSFSSCRLDTSPLRSFTINPCICSRMAWAWVGESFCIDLSRSTSFMLARRAAWTSSSLRRCSCSSPWRAYSLLSRSRLSCSSSCSTSRTCTCACAGSWLWRRFTRSAYTGGRNTPSRGSQSCDSSDCLSTSSFGRCSDHDSCFCVRSCHNLSTSSWITPPACFSTLARRCLSRSSITSLWYLLSRSRLSISTSNDCVRTCRLNSDSKSSRRSLSNCSCIIAASCCSLSFRSAACQWSRSRCSTMILCSSARRSLRSASSCSCSLSICLAWRWAIWTSITPLDRMLLCSCVRARMSGSVSRERLCLR